jgi:2-oxoglutarate dehydrogenase E1 component
MTDIAQRPQDFGANSWLVEEMYEQFRTDPNSVSEAWREFFSDYKSSATAYAAPNDTVTAPSTATTSAPAVAPPVSSPAVAPASAAPVTKPATPQVNPSGVEPQPLRGVGAAIVANMERSLSVPTATSFRNVPARLLEVNRKGINDYRSRLGMSKVSFTHADGKPQIIRNPYVNIGLAVDVDKGDGQRSLVVPVLRDADTMSFAQFLVAYDELIRKVKNNKLTMDDFQGATVSLTNPGTIGTVQSVPRLMP